MINRDTDSVTAVIYAVTGGRFNVNLTEDRGPGRRSGNVIDNDGNVIGYAYDSIYNGSGFCVQTKPFGGYVPTEQIDFVTNAELAEVRAMMRRNHGESLHETGGDE